MQDDTANLYGDYDEPPPSEPDGAQPAAADPLDELLEGVLPGVGPPDAPSPPIMAAAGAPTSAHACLFWLKRLQGSCQHVSGPAPPTRLQYGS